MAWDAWLAEFDNYLLACGTDALPEPRKVAVLVHCLGREGARVFQTLTTSGRPETLQAAKDRLSSHFKPTANVRARRHEFRKCVQRSGESIQTFIANLRHAARQCDFKAMQDELMIYQLIYGTSAEVREQLLLKSELTLEQALELATQVESSIQTEHTFTSSSSIKKVSEPPGRRVNQSSSAKQQTAGLKCSHCGRIGHASGADSRCPARGQACRTCGKLNHFAAVCKSSAKQPGKGRVREIELETQNIYSVRQAEGQFKQATVLLDGKPVQLLIDTAAKVSLLSSTTWKRVFGSTRQLEPAGRKLRAYNDSSIEALGEVETTVEFSGSTVQGFSFTVVPQGDDLMGVDLFDKLGLQVQGPSGQRIAMVEQQPSAPLPPWIPSQYHDVGDGLGEIVGFCHRPRLNPTVPPVAQRPRRVPLALQQACADQISSWEKQGIVERVPDSYQPDWQSNMTCAKKADGSLRLCIDLRAVNKAIIPDQMVLPSFTDLVTSFSRIDLNQSYLQLPLHPAARDLTCFHTETGLYRFRRMPFGLSSAPAAFQKVIGNMLRGVPGTVHYIDDIVVHAASETEHDRRVIEVLKRLRRHHVTVNTRKCTFRQGEIDFVGHHISAEGIQPLQTHVEAVTKLKAPTDTKELASFLGFAKFFQLYAKNLSRVAAPLLALLKKGVDWIWSGECQKAFNDIKELIAGAPCLKHFDPTHKTVVSCDSSNAALGAVLSQADSDGHLRPVAFASRSLSETERRYSATEKEALACLWSCEHWHLLLYGRKFTLTTDHRALTTLLSPSGTGQRPLRLQRWCSRLFCYDFDITFVPGQRNVQPDFLSRYGYGDGEAARGEAKVERPTVEEADVNAVLARSSSPVQPEQLADATAKDSTLSRVIGFVAGSWPKVVPAEFKAYHQVRHELSLWQNGRCLARGSRAVIPECLRVKVLDEAHQGHLGVAKVKARCRDSVWWPKVDADIEDFVRRCGACVTAEKAFKPLRTSWGVTNLPAGPWRQIQVDILGELTAREIPHSHRYLIVVHDLYSKWPEVVASSSITTSACIEALQGLFVRWGLPDEVTTDNGPQFVSAEFTDFLASTGIEHRRTPRYCPPQNGGVERFNGFIKGALRALLADGVPGKQAVQELLLAYRTAPHSLTEKTPAELMLGRKLRMPLDKLRPPVPESATFQDLRAQITQKQHRLWKRRPTPNDTEQRRLQAVTPGTLVRVRRPRRVKLTSGISEPKRVVNRQGKTVELEDGSRWHLSRCIPEPERRGWYFDGDCEGEGEGDCNSNGSVGDTNW
jgi:hypothetical protein